MIDLLLLGTGGMMPLPDRWLSSLLVRTGGRLVLFDCGEGTQIPWQASGWGFRRLSTICLSHMHADHVAGLPGVLHAVANADRTEPVTIIGPPGTSSVVNALRTIAPVLPFEVDVREVEEGDELGLTGGVTIQFMRGDHRLPCIGFRMNIPRGRRFLAKRAQDLNIPTVYWNQLQQGHNVPVDGRLIESESVLGPPRQGLSIAYVTDTRPVKGLAAFLAGVDLLVCEGTYGDNEDHQKAVERKHMTFAEAAELARKARAGHLWLTHFSPAVSDPMNYLQNAVPIFSDVTIGSSGLTKTLSFNDEVRNRS